METSKKITLMALSAGIIVGLLIATKKTPAITGQYSGWLDTYLDWKYIRNTGNEQRIE